MRDKMLDVLHRYDEMRKARLSVQAASTRRRLKAMMIAKKARGVVNTLYENGVRPL